MKDRVQRKCNYNIIERKGRRDKAGLLTSAL